jgi:hypothetical protein
MAREHGGIFARGAQELSSRDPASLQHHDALNALEVEFRPLGSESSAGAEFDGWRLGKDANES